MIDESEDGKFEHEQNDLDDLEPVEQVQHPGDSDDDYKQEDDNIRYDDDADNQLDVSTTSLQKFLIPNVSLKLP